MHSGSFKVDTMPRCRSLPSTPYTRTPLDAGSARARNTSTSAISDSAITPHPSTPHPGVFAGHPQISPHTPHDQPRELRPRYDPAPMPIAVPHAYVLSDASALSSYQQQHHTYHTPYSSPHPHYYQLTQFAHPHHPRIPIPMPASNHSGSESPQANKRKRSRAGCYTCRRRKVS